LFCFVLISLWLNGTNDSNSSTSPISSSTPLLNIVSLVDDQKTIPVSLLSSSSKKRKSVPQKIVTNNNNITKKFHSGSTIIENEGTTNESTSFIDVLS
jgi:hypothetical protein